MCSVSVVTVVFIHTMEDDQRPNTLVHEGDALRFSVYHCKKPENRCTHGWEGSYPAVHMVGRAVTQQYTWLGG